MSIEEVVSGLRATVAITGSASNTGKTWLVESVVSALVDAGLATTALKVTRTHVDTCPRENDACGVCEDLETPWRVVTDPALLDIPGKDTGRYLDAGADKVLWLLAQPEHMRGAVWTVLPLVKRGTVLVAEGNSFRDYVTACDLTLMALGAEAEMKPSASHVIDRVDAFVCRERHLAAVRRQLETRGLSSRPLVVANDAAEYVVRALEEGALRGQRGMDMLPDPGTVS